MRPQPAEFDLPGVTPSRQQRSRETTAALLQAGAEMLRTRSLARIVDRSALRESRRHRRRVLQPVRKQGGLFQRADGARHPRWRARAVGDVAEHAAGRAGVSRCAAAFWSSGIIGWMQGMRAYCAPRCGTTTTGRTNGPPFKAACPRQHRTRHPSPAAGHGQGPQGGQDPRHRLRLSGRAGNAGQRHPQRSRAAVTSRPARWRCGSAIVCCSCWKPRCSRSEAGSALRGGARGKHVRLGVELAPVQAQPFSPENAPPSVLAKARTERVERRTGEGGDLHDPAPADCPDIDANLLMSLSNYWGMV